MKRRSVLFLVAAVLAWAVCGGCASSEPVTIRVLTYNIHHGEGLDGETDLARIADVIRNTNADLVALQEVDRGVRRTDGVDQPARLGELTGMAAVFEKNADIQGGDYGNAVLSRYPIERYVNHKLPRMGENEQRGLLEVHVRVNGREVVFFATHVDHQEDDSERLASVDALRGCVAQFKGKPVIVAGDMNARPDGRVIERMDAFLNNAAIGSEAETLSFPADSPDRRIDYVFYTEGTGLRAAGCEVIDEPVASDHRPVLATLELRRD